MTASLVQLPARRTSPGAGEPARPAPVHGDGASLLDRLAAALEPARVLARPIDVVAYASDASFYRLVPRVVLQPKSEDEIRRIFEVSHATGLPVTFRAAGTSLSGQAVTDGLLVDLSKHWGELEVLAGGGSVRVAPGVVGGRVNAVLARHGRRIGPDPASIDACMIGGILANNASGMCCGVVENAYHTLESIRFVLPSGLAVDTADPRANEVFAAGAPELAEGLLALRDRVLADPALAARVRSKYRMKNTTGYSLNALLDFDDPAQIFAHLLIGSEGTLAFISQAVLKTLPDYPAKRTGLLLFESAERAAEAVAGFAASGARAIELMDHASLRSVGGVPGVDVAALPPGAVALLVEYQAEDEARLEALRGAEVEAVAGARPIAPGRFTSDPEARSALWRVRKGLLPTAGATKRSGETVIIEDVAFPLERLPAAIADLRAVFERDGYSDAIVFGHAKDGNLHFILRQSFETKADVDRYARLMRDVADVVIHRHDGAMKAEHGTGRNVAPFVEAEWGREAYAIMRELKALSDPRGLLNPGVILNDDPDVFISNLKTLPAVDEEIDRCVECGFCEPTCPSRRLTLTPRQRIVVRRELARRTDPRDPVRVSLARDFAYSGLDTCAADGLCASACPVKIDTGALVKRLRGERHGALSSRLARLLAGHLGLVERMVRVGLEAAHLVEAVVGVRALAGLTRLFARLVERLTGLRLPRWSANIPRVPPPILPVSTRDAEVVYVPTCLSRVMGLPRGESLSLPEVVAILADRAGIVLRVPDGLLGRCCGLPFGSKGFAAEHGDLLGGLVDLMYEASDAGRLPIVLDASSCLYGVKASGAILDPPHRARLAKLRILDLTELARDILLPRLVLAPLDRRVALHPTCATRKLELAGALKAVAVRAAKIADVPIALGCCATAGDRGLLYPELAEAAVFDERRELDAGGYDGFYATNLTCELGLSESTGHPWRSILYLLEEASRPVAE